MYKLKTPQAPLALTTAGLIPYFACAGIMLVNQDDVIQLNSVAVWLMTYSALILSFLGGIRWGVEMAQRDKPRFIELGGAVIAPLAAWGLVMAFFTQGAKPLWFILMAAAIALFWFWDFASSRLPGWYQKLRIWPTLGAVLSLGVAYYLLGQTQSL